jgi:hypothetical protein
MKSAWILAACWMAASLPAQQQLKVEPPHDSGQSITPAFEGWFPNPDGSFSILFGYFNRNMAQELDIPAGPENKIEPGSVDQGQPTHFMTRRQWGVFTITVPKDFGTKKLTWTITANGITTSIPASLDPLWEVNPFLDASGNAPPYIGFKPEGPFVEGPKGQTETFIATVGVPMALPVWVADDANLIPGATRPRTPPIVLTWKKYRGPGTITFSSVQPNVEDAEFKAPLKTTVHGKAATSVSFGQPGEYVLHISANDWTGEGGRGFQCCWSNAQVKVQVQAAR